MNIAIMRTLYNRFYILGLVLAALSFLPPRDAIGANGAWSTNASGLWSDTANWSGGIVADGATNIADISTVNITTNRTVTLDSGRTIGALKFGDATTSSHDWTLAASGGSILTLSSNGTPGIFVNNRTATISLELAGTEGFIKSGGGTLSLSSTNTYTGPTTVNGGVLFLKDNLALGNTSGITVNSNNMLRLANGVTISGKPLTIFWKGSNNGALQADNGTSTWAGPITLGDSQARLGTAQAGGTLVVDGVIDDGGNNFGLNVRCGDSTGEIFSTALLNAQGAYAGTTAVIVGILKLGGDNRIPAKSVLAIGNGSNVDKARFDLAGFNQVVAGLTYAGATMEITITNSSGTSSILTVSNDTSVAYGSSSGSGLIAGDITLVKTGPGTQTLSRANAYTGSTIVSNGVLRISASGAIGSSTNITVEAGGQLVVENSAADVIGNSNVVIVKSGAPDGLIYLTNGVYDVVGKLFFDGAEQAVGTWGSSASAAANTNDTYFAGQGILAVGMPTGSDGSWSNDSNGAWSTAGNWTNSVIASGPGKSAYFTNAISSDRTISQDFSSLFIGSVTFGSPGSFSWIVTNNPLVFSGATPAIAVNTNTATIASTVNAPAGLVKSGSGKLILSGTNSVLGSTTIKQATLSIAVSNALLPDATLTFGDSTTNINAGTLDMAGGSQTISALDTITRTSNNATDTNAIINIASGQALNIINTNIADNTVLIREGTHLQVSGAGSMNIITTNGTIFIWGFRSTNEVWGMDLSQLGYFSASVSNIYVGYDNNNVTRQGQLILAGTNTITAGSIYIGWATQGGGVVGQLRLGASNVLNISDLHVANGKASGNIDFNPFLTNGQLTLQGTNGMRANVYLGEFNQPGSGTLPTGNLIITNTGSSISAQLNQMVLGTLNEAGNGAAAGGYGNFTFNNGTVDVNTLILGRNMGFTRGAGRGTLTMNGGTLNVNTQLTLASGSVPTGTISGTLILNGGTANVYTNIEDGGGTSLLTLNGGTLDMRGNSIGSASTNIDSISLLSGTLMNVAEINGGAALIKSGPGTLVLAGTNGFTGDTTVSEGVLHLAAPGNMISDAATVRINSGATIYLTNGINESVGKLVFDGVPQAAGTWGKPGSGATHEDARFDGPVAPGIMTVLLTDAGFWSNNGDGNWSDPANWTNNVVATGELVTASFANTITADRTVNQDSNALNIAGIYFGSPAFNWAISNNTINLTNASGAPTLTVAANTATVASAISGGQGLTKIGAGTLILSGTNAYTGTTFINNGTLKIGATDSLPISGDLTIGNLANIGSLDLSGFSQAVGSLTTRFTNSSPADIINIGSGRTLTVNGATTFGLYALTNVTPVQSSSGITGAGTFAINTATGNLVIGSSLDSNRGYTTTTVTMAGLNFFNAAISNLYVGRSQDTGDPDPRNIGQLTLATSNTITAANSIQIGTTLSGADTVGSYLMLGQTNMLNTGKIVIGGGRGSGSLAFADGLADPVLRIRGATGGLSRASIYIGDQGNASGLSGGGGSSDATGAFTPTNGIIDAMLDWLVIGNGGINSGVYGRGTGTFIFGKSGSTVDVNILVVGRTIANGTTAGSIVTHSGTLTMTGGSFNVNSTVIIANNMDDASGTTQHVVGAFNLLGGMMTVGTTLTLGTHNSTGPGVASGTLNLSNGTLTVNGDIQQGTTGYGFNVSTVTLAGATLDLTGHKFGGASTNNSITTLNIECGTLKNVTEINSGAPLVKTTAGTLVLTGTNTYTGATIVDDGVLQLTGTGNIINDAASLTINGSGKVYIDTGINEVVMSLYIDGLPQPAGTWGKPGSGATHEDAHFDGPGTPGIITVQTSNGSWNKDEDGSWSNPLKWLNGLIPDGTMVTAFFTNAVTTGRTVDQNYPTVNLANMVFGSPSYSWLVQNNSINLSSSSGTPAITVNANTATVASAITGTQSLVKTGTGTLILSGTNAYTGGTFINRGTLTIGANNTLPSNTSMMIGNTSGAGSLDLSTFSQTITNLLFASSGNGATNNIFFGNGGSLTVNGNVAVGQDLASTTVSLAAMAGSGGTLIVTTNGGTFQVSAGNTQSGTAGVKATLDMSELAIAIINLGANGKFYVGDTQGNNFGADPSTIVLASNTTITAGTITLAPGGRGSFPQTMKLGYGSNTLCAGVINVGTAVNRDSGILMFNSSNGTLRIRGLNGIDRCVLNIGVGTATTGYSATNICDLTGHNIDLLLSMFSVGEEARGGPSVYTFSADTGTIDTTGLRIGSRPAAGTPNATNSIHYYTANIAGGTIIVGTDGIAMGNNFNNSAVATIVPVLNMSGGNMTVNGGISMLNQGSTNVSILSSINLSGGSLAVSGDIITSISVGSATSGTATLTINGGTLDMQGHNVGGTASNNWIDVLSFQNGTLRNCGQINNGSSDLVKTTAGTLFIEGANYYTSSTIISNGTLNIASGGSINSSTSITVEAGAQLTVENPAGNAIRDNSIINLKYQAGPGYGQIYLTNGINEIVGSLYSNGIQLAMGTWGAPGSGAGNTNSDFFTGPGLLTVLGNQDGSWNVDTNGNWNTATNWINSRIPMGYGTTAFFTNATSSDLVITQNNPNVYLGNLTFGSPGNFNWTVTNNSISLSQPEGIPAITVNSATATVASIISGSQGLIKQGAGTLVLTAGNTYTGNTVVSGGTFILNGSIHSNSAINVTNTGILAGTTALAGAVSVSDGAALSPAGSNTAGILTIGNLNLAYGAAINWDYSTNSTCDLVTITNQLNLTPGAVYKLRLFNLKDLAQPATQQFVVINWAPGVPDPETNVIWYVEKPAGGGAEGWASPQVTMDMGNRQILLTFPQSGAPSVDNGFGATNITADTAVLTGNYTATGAPAEVYIYWGSSDGGTDKANWDHVYTNGTTDVGAFSTLVSDLFYGLRYSYRCYASNTAGQCWAPVSSNFAIAHIPKPADGLRASIFTGLPGNDTPQVLADSAYSISYSRVFTGGTTANLLGMAEDPQWNVIVTGEISGYGMFPGFVPGDQFAVAFSGQLIPRASGTHNFRWSCDDRGMMYIDLNGDGIFQSSEGVAIAPAGNANGSADLTAGQVYNFIFSARDYAGGQSINFYVTEPAQSEARVNTTVQAGMWRCYVINTLSNGPASDITTTSATLNATLMNAGERHDIYIYWGLTSGASTASDWTNSAFVGSWTNTASSNISYAVTGLDPDSIYFYTFRATNSFTNTWADSVRDFKTTVIPAAYTNRMKIFFSAYDKDETLTNFPALLNFGEHLPGFYYNNFQPGGTDLRFMDEAETNELFYEIEAWNSNGNSTVWVQLPELTNNCMIWAYWGNPASTIAPPYTTNGSAWSTDYYTVHHFGQTNGYLARDSSPARHNGTLQNMNNGDWVPGKIAGSLNFGGNASQHVLEPSYAIGGQLSISAWVYYRGFNNNSRVVDFGISTTNNGNISLFNETYAGNARFELYQGSTARRLVRTNLWQGGAWQHITAIVDESGLMQIYKNGELSQARLDGWTPLSMTRNSYIGRNVAGSDGYFNGIMDELRIASVPNSSNWVWASWLNQISSDTFATCVPTFGVRHGNATSINSLSAALNATHYGTGTAAAVVLYFGQSDGGTNTAAWGFSKTLGNFTTSSQTNIFTSLLSLRPDTTYYFRFRASSGSTVAWSQSSGSFKTTVSDWTRFYKMMITFPGYNRPETLANFPALVILNQGITNFFYNTFQPGGIDLRFVDSTMTNELSYEIDEWNSNGNSYVWVKIPDFTNNCSIWAYWGNSASAMPISSATNGSTWSGGFNSVWHMRDGSSTAYDSVARYTGTPANVTSATGMIGRALAFNGSTSRLTTSYGQHSAAASTISAWIRSSDSGLFRGIMSDRGSGPWNSLTLGTRQGSGNPFFGLDSASTTIGVDGTPAFNDNAWHYLAGVWSAPTGTAINASQFNLYFDGVPAATTPTSTGTAPASPLEGSGSALIGYHQAWNMYLAAYLDEVRAESTVRSSNWIWACYMNQGTNDPGFVIYGPVTETPGPGTFIFVR